MVCLAVIICCFTHHKRKELAKYSQKILPHLILNGHIQVAVVGFVWWQCAWNGSMNEEELARLGHNA